MFTGIIEEVGKVLVIRERNGKRYPTLAAQTVNTDLRVGDSLACDGICLTVVEVTPRQLTVEIMRETLLKSTAETWQTGRELNLERACRLNGRLDGHIVQGHVDTVSRLLSSREIDGTLYLCFALPASFRDHVVPQGSIAVNGVSLTVAELDSGSFTVALIGHTRTHTDLPNLRPGMEANLEFDILGKYVLRRLSLQHSTLTEDKLVEMGF